MNCIKHLAVTLAATFVLTTVVSAEDATPAATLPPAASKTGVTYATDIKPIFDASCVKCHSGDRPKSVIIKAVAHLTKEPEGWMPPPNNKAGIKPLTPEEIGLIRAWIDQGA